jgi:hypothetical protein
VTTAFDRIVAESRVVFDPRAIGILMKVAAEIRR